MSSVSFHPERCLTCSYVLAGLETPGKCPECGRQFDLAIPNSYTTKPPIVWWLWGPGLILGIGGGLIMTAFLTFVIGSWGYALWIGVPFSTGCLAGYRFRVSRIVLPLLSLAVLLSLILGIASMGLAGVFCGMVLAGIFSVPILVGILLGFGLRAELRRRDSTQSHYLPIVVFLLLPPAWAVLEGGHPGMAIERVSTVETIAATPAECWDAIIYFEDVKHEPPLILRVGLARPLYTVGSAKSVGDTKLCVYNKGHITKRVTQAEPGRVLAFDVVDQHIGYERDVRLLRGSFTLLPSPGGTRVTLTTEYQPLLAPRFCWRPAEWLAVHVLHAHVLEGMKLKAKPAELHASGGNQ